jgi:hypothetical protein
VAFVEEHQVKGCESNDNNKNDEENEVGDEAATVEGFLCCGVEVGTDDLKRVRERSVLGRERERTLPALWPMKRTAVVVFFLVSPAVFCDDQE